jgi:integrase
MTKITKRVVDKEQLPESGQRFIWDSDLKGFGLRLTPTRKTYIVQGRVKGRTVRATIGAHDPFTPEQARLEAKKKLGELAGGIHLNQAKRDAKALGVTLASAYQEYITSRALSENTLTDYAKAMRLGFKDWEYKPLREIDRNMIEARFNKLSDISPAQANQMFRFLRAVFNFAKEKYANADGEPLVPSNPCDRLTALKKWHRIAKRTSHIEPHQVKAWFGALQHSPWDSEQRRTFKDYCALVLLTGCREQEAARLEWTDVDLRGGGAITFRQTKNHQPYTLPIGKWLLAMLKRRMEADAKKERDDRSAYVFPAENKYGHIKNHSKAVLSVAKASGVDFRLHDLRRTFVSIVNHQLSRSFSVYTIKRLMNHSATDVTGGYIQIGVEDLREPMTMIETFLLKHAGLVKGSQIIDLAPRVRRQRVA